MNDMKKIPFLEGYYITEDGTVYSNKRGGLKKVKAFFDKKADYMRIKLVESPKVPKKYLVHRLVALTYLDKPKDLDYVNHFDGNKLNNHVSNLQWCTSSENQEHAFAVSLKTNSGTTNPKNILSESQVLEIYNKLLQGSRSVDLAKEHSVSKSCISGIKSKTVWAELLKDLPDVPRESRSKRLSEASVNWICEMLSRGNTPHQILKISNNDNIKYHAICDISRRKNFKHISCNYDF